MLNLVSEYLKVPFLTFYEETLPIMSNEVSVTKPGSQCVETELIPSIKIPEVSMDLANRLFRMSICHK